MTTQTTSARPVRLDDWQDVTEAGAVLGQVRKGPRGDWYWRVAGEDAQDTQPTRAAAADAILRCLAVRAMVAAEQQCRAARAEREAAERAERDPFVEFARLGFMGANGQGVSLDFRTTAGTSERLIAMTEAAHLPWGRSFVAEVWPYVSTVEIGREGSEVLYVTIPFTRQQAHGGDGQCVFYTDAERVAIAERVIAWARSAGADEISTQQHPYGDGPVWNGAGEHPYRVRVWWD